MSTLDELRTIANDMKLATAKGAKPNIRSQLDALEHCAKDAAKAASGSWLGYHANVYYEGLVAPRPGHHFSQEWGLQGDDFLRLGSKGPWTEYDAEQIQAHIHERAGNPDMDKLRNVQSEVDEKFEDAKSALTSILTTAIEARTDKFLEPLLKEVTELELLSQSEVVKSMMPRGQIMTRDTTALGQGNRAPPHIKVLASAYSIKFSFEACKKLETVANKLASHLQRSEVRRPPPSGSHVFIGHGRSTAWRELKDFVQDRLGLPWDEFNRVPVAGITNIARLAQMMDSAAVALLVLTAEDELKDGNVQARMNVVHEAGLFQGRLGFSKAIVVIEEGCKEFSNIEGLGQIRFPKGNIGAAFEEVRRVLEREGLIE